MSDFERELLADVSITKIASGPQFEARMIVPGGGGWMSVRGLSHQQSADLERLLNAAMRQTVRNTQYAARKALGMQSK